MAGSSAPARPRSHLVFLHDNPAAVGAWCRERLTAGALFIAPSASAKREALRSVAERSGVAVGIAITTPGHLLSLLEGRAGLLQPKTMSAALARLVLADCARAAGVPLFDDERVPGGAIRAVSSLVASLRMNGVAPAQYRDAGGDARAADACARFERRRVELGFVDDADRIRRLISAGVPAVPLIVHELSFANRLIRDLYDALFVAAPSVHVGLTRFGDDGPAAIVLSRLAAVGFDVQRVDAHIESPEPRAIGGVGPFDEATVVAREMLALLRATPHRGSIHPSQILGVAPNASYLRLLHRACARAGIPVASPQRLPAADAPLVRTLLDTMRLLADAEQDSAERGLALLATPYFGCTLDQHDRLSRALVRRSLGALRTWRRVAPTAGNARFTAFAEAVVSLAAQLDGDRTPQQLASVLTSLGLEYKCVSSGRRSYLAAGNDDAVRIDQQGWDALVSAVDELANALRLLGIQRISAARWLDALTDVLDGSTVRVEAKARDGVHLTIAGSGIPCADHVFAVGWREGLVPRRVREDPLLPDRVKRVLADGGALLDSADDRVAGERQRYERVRRAAAKSLTITWPAVGAEGEPMLPSFYMDDMRVRQRTVRSVRDTLVALDDPRDRVRDGKRNAPRQTVLPPTIRAELAERARASSASQAKMLAHCVYEHFGKRRLRLEALVPPTLDALALGKIMHGALRALGMAGFSESALVPALDAAWNANVPEPLAESPGAQFERELLTANLMALIERESARLAALPCRPVHFELAFGTRDEARDPASRDDGIALDLPPEAGIPSTVLRGSIDRVDVTERDGRRFGVAVDYKSGKGESYFKDMQELADFQLPIYTLALPAFGIEPVGAMYLGLASGERYGVIRRDFAGDFLTDDGCKGVKQLEPEEFADYMQTRLVALRQDLARASTGVLEIKAREDNCGYCDLRPVCRIGTFGVGGVFNAE